MKEVDFKTYKFRCSSVGNLMVGNKSALTENQAALIQQLQSKTTRTGKQEAMLQGLIEKQNSPAKFSLTAETYLTSIWVEAVLGRRQQIETEAMVKGTWQEEASISLLSEVDGELYFKNEEKGINDYVHGTPDVVNTDEVIDIKSRENIWSFLKGDVSDLYYWQLQCYMWLFNLPKARLAYTLVSAPSFLVESAIKRRAYELSMQGVDYGDKRYIDEIEQIKKNMEYDDIAPGFRLQCEHYEYNQEDIEKLKITIDRARNWLTNFDTLMRNRQ